jgi:hypothetical protein
LQFQTIAELYRLDLIPKRLVVQITDNIAAQHESNSGLMLVNHLEMVKNDAAMHCDTGFYKFVKDQCGDNIFLKGLDYDSMVELLRHSTMMVYKPGEVIYSSGQPSSASSLMLTKCTCLYLAELTA